MLLTVNDLKIAIGKEEAVRSSSFSVPSGSITALIGESGSGKSLTGMAVASILPHYAHPEGSIVFDGQNILALTEKEKESIRGKGIVYVFQDASAALNPVYTIGHQLKRAAGRKDNSSLFKAFGLEGKENSYPFELSGGLRMRAELMIASAVSPRLLIADEITAGMDSVTARSVLELLRDRRKDDQSVLLITHDIRRASAFADRIVVMHAGETVEEGDAEEVLQNPGHPYTAALLRSSRLEVTENNELWTIKGTMPLPSQRPEGCTFRNRCPVQCTDEAVWHNDGKTRVRCAHPCYH